MRTTCPPPPLILNRRGILGGAVGLGAGLVFPACAANGNTDDHPFDNGSQPPAGEGEPRGRNAGRADLDPKIMTFALNLEYLEAEYYTRGAYGHSLRDHGGDTGRNPGEVRGGHKVNFRSKWFQDHAEELAFNEAAHVAFLREQLKGSAPDAPAIDFEGAFDAVARAAGIVEKDERFDPFADEVSFFLGGMLFEDVGVTAYHGAVPLISSKEVLDAAAGILAVEAYHMGMARFLILHSGPEWTEAANKISAARDKLDGGARADQPLIMDGKANIVPNDKNGIAFKRTPRQVLSIVCLKPDATRGGFYPDGMNGDLSGLI